MKIEITDYKKHIRERLNVFIDTKSVKEMMFIKIEVLNLLDIINTKEIPTIGIEELLNNTIDIAKLKQDKLEDYGSLIMFLDKQFYEKL